MLKLKFDISAVLGEGIKVGRVPPSLQTSLVYAMSDEKYSTGKAVSEDEKNVAESPPNGWSDDSSEYDTSNDKALLRKLDRKLLPALTLLYLLSFLDRSNGQLKSYPLPRQSTDTTSRQCAR